MARKSEEAKKPEARLADWKAKLSAPVKDTRYKTTVRTLNDY